ncbi:unnamed protein product, partial [Rotaria magnacalcarata]
MNAYNSFDTLARYKDSSGRDRLKVTKRFGIDTRFNDVNKWITLWWKVSCDYDIQIKDRHGRFVDFDQEYIEEYNPFDVSQSTTLASPLIELQIVSIYDNQPNTTTNVSLETRTNPFPIVMQEQHQTSRSFVEPTKIDVAPVINRHHFSTLCAPDSIAINGNEAAMKLTNNVNDIQRDHYVDDKTCSCFVRIQGDKKHLIGNKQHAAVMPRLQ